MPLQRLQVMDLSSHPTLTVRSDLTSCLSLSFLVLSIFPLHLSLLDFRIDLAVRVNEIHSSKDVSRNHSRPHH